MADEIVSKLGFEVTDALAALARLDTALKGTEGSLSAFGASLAAWSAKGASAIAVMSALATAAQNTARAMSKMTTPGVAPGATAAPTAQLWLPSGVQSSAQQAAASMTAVGTAATQAGAKTTQAMNQAAAATKNASDKTSGLTVSWQTLARVVVTQMIVRTLSMIRDAFTESYQSAAEFAKQVNEIAAINPERTTSAIAADLRQLSDAFNQPLARVAEAQYQTISDQFVSTADRTNILTAANILAKTSNQDLADSSMLLTGALNAYNESSDMAGLRAAQFFKTVELGRLRMGELGAAMGRTQGIAHELGVSMEELEASFIAITIGGVKPAEAATQMRGVMSALIKPSDDMKVALRGLGVESGEAAIATWGLAGTLEQLWNVSGKTATGMSQLFRNIRGDIGALRIAAEGAQKYAEGLKAVNEIDLATLRAKFQVVMGSDVERLTADLNKVKNFFTTEFGAGLISSLRSVVSLLGGGNGLVPTFRALTNQAAPMAAALGVIGVAMLAVAAHTQLAKLKVEGLNSAFLALAALPAAKALGEIIGSRIGGWITGADEAAREVLTQNLARREELAAAEIRVGERKNKEIVRQVRQSVAEVNQFYLQDAVNFQTALKVEEKLVQTAFDRIMETRRKMTQELAGASDAASKIVAELAQQIITTEQGIADRTFNTQVQRLNPADQFKKYRDQAEALASVAARLQGAAIDKSEEKAADAAWKRADAYATLAQQSAQQSGNLDTQQKAVVMLTALDEMRIRAARQQTETQQDAVKELESRAAQAQQHSLELDQLRLDIEQKLKVASKDAGGVITVKGTDRLAKDLMDAEVLIGTFVQKTKDYGKEDFIKDFLGDPRAFESLKREAERALAAPNLKKIELAPQTIEDLHAQLQQSIADVVLKVPILAEIEKITGMNLLSDGFTGVLDVYEKRLNGITTRAARIPQLMASQMDVEAAYQEARARAGKVAQAVAVLPTPLVWGAETQAARSNVNTVLGQLDQVQLKTKITDEDIRKLSLSVLSIDWSNFSWGANVGTTARLQASLTTMLEALKQQKALQQLQRENAPPTVIPSDPRERMLQQIKEEAEAAEDAATGVDMSLKAGTGAAADVKAALTDVSQLDMTGLTGQIMGLVGVMQMLAQTAYVVPNITMSATGGKMWDFLAGGGSPRGTDVMPAMLTPGEVVINAQSARRFSSQLTAMNAGVQPSFHSVGGSVTNVGDINVSVTGGGSSHQTARSIASELRRELRRGTSTL